MTRVAFLIPSSFSTWIGGINYYRNLLLAVLADPERRIEPVLVIGNSFDPALLGRFPHVEAVRTALLDRFGPSWSLRMATRAIASADWFLERELRRNRIDLVSHYSGYLGSRTGMRLLGWIPDFQHIHYPEYFSRKELRLRDRTFNNIVTLSSRVLLSSHSARDDFRSFAPALDEKARIMHFVSQPDRSVWDPALANEQDLRYGKHKKYFFLPNQFWKHKNHQVVFQAVRILRDRGRPVTVLCSGSTADYRNRRHSDELREYLRVNGLEENVCILGMVSSADLFYLMRNSVSVLNPSLFEGWSTTVEEAKSLGKNMVLSDIPVHREQAPPGSVYFDPHNAEQLADILDRKEQEHPGGPDLDLERSAREQLPARTREFARSYERIVLEFAP